MVRLVAMRSSPARRTIGFVTGRGDLDGSALIHRAIGLGNRPAQRTRREPSHRVDARGDEECRWGRSILEDIQRGEGQ